MAAALIKLSIHVKPGAGQRINHCQSGVCAARGAPGAPGGPKGVLSEHDDAVIYAHLNNVQI